MDGGGGGPEFGIQSKQGIARDLPRTGSETNTTILVIYNHPHI